jgi:hypothetical protein
MSVRSPVVIGTGSGWGTDEPDQVWPMASGGASCRYECFSSSFELDQGHRWWRAVKAGCAIRRRQRYDRFEGQDWMKASKSAFTASAWVVGMPWGKSLYVFSVAFWRSSADRGPAAT